MFYAHFVLAKKGPLSKIWLAAHWDKKLTKAHVFETNIETSVDGILKPKVKMALRTSGHLLLGVVRIYSRKAKYLLQDCNEAFVKIKMAFRPGMVDLPEEHREAAMNAITLPEVFHDFDTAMPELNEVDIEAQFSLNQSRAEEITMREDYGSLNLVTHDDGFGDMGFDTDNPDIMRDAIGNTAGLEQSNLLFGDGSSLELGGGTGKAGGALPAPAVHRRMEPAPIDDAFGPPITDVSDFGRDIGGEAGGLFEGDLFGEVSAAAAPPPLPDQIHQPMETEAGAAADSDDDLPDHYDAGDSPAHSWGRSPAPEPPAPAEPTEMEVDPVVPPPPEPEPQHDNTTLLQNEEESFALAPVDATVLKGITKTKRKRKLIVDEVKNISGEEMKNQLSNTSDIVTTLDLAPPTRRLMHWKETGGVEKLFTLPASQIPTTVLFKKYQRIMSWRAEAEEAATAAAAPDEPEPPRRPTRKRKAELLPPPEPVQAPVPQPHHYEPSVEPEPSGRDSRADIDDNPATPGMLSSLGPPLTPAPLTPGLLQGLDATPHHDMFAGGGGLTPALGLDAGMTPGGLSHGGITPGGLEHGGLSSGLQAGGLTPAGLQHAGLTPAGLHHGGLTPAGLHHGGLTPAGLHHGGMTPAGLQHGGMTPIGLQHGGMTPMGLQHGGMTPAGMSGSVMLSSAAVADPAPHHMALDYRDQSGLQMTNLGYEEGAPPSPHDYDLPPSVEPPDSEGSREADETEEQFEQRVLNRRAAQLFHSLKPKLADRECLTFIDVAPPHNRRKQVAQKFYSLLVLKKHQVLKLEQHETYGVLTITRGIQFETETM